MVYGGLAILLITAARRFDWAEVQRALFDIPLRSACLAVLCSAACYVMYAGYELLAARHLGLKLGRTPVALIGFASYSCNLSLGATFGAIGLRLRLYAARGVDPGGAMSVVAFNMLTNWSGYLLVMGSALLLQWSPAPASWPVEGVPLRVAGAGLLGLLAVHLFRCWRHSDRTWHWRTLTLQLPGLRGACAQLALSAPAWLLGSVSLSVLLAETPFDLVLISLLAAAVAGLVIRIPAGLGVIEATVLASLGPGSGHGKVLAALLAYRCIHYLLPLALGLLTALGLEIHHRLHPGKAARRAA
jgi:uncharacterized membrane protein YbhN (UPF0104 family)